MRVKDVRGEIRWISNGSTRRVLEKLLDLLEAAEIDGIIAAREMEQECMAAFEKASEPDTHIPLRKMREVAANLGVKKDAEEEGSTE